MNLFHRIGLALGALLMIATVGLGFYAEQHGIVYLKTSGDPKETVARFYDALLAQDYETAYGFLQDCDTLGLEDIDLTLPEHLPADCRKQFRDAMIQSYAYELVGEPTVRQLDARQPVRFICFDPERFCQDLDERFYQMLGDNVQDRPKHEMFDDDGNYRVEMLERIYAEALREAMRGSGQYLQTMEYEVELRYQDKEWKILVNEEMTEGFVGRQR